MTHKFKQGLYTPKHPNKYVGDLTHIRYMSSWELELCEFFDSNPNILRWSSESLVIPYIKPTDGKIHRYYPDYWVEYITRSGNIIQEIIECKPREQTRPPRKARNGKVNLYEAVQYEINVAKWAAAVDWCKSRGIEFRIVTQKTIFR